MSLHTHQVASHASPLPVELGTTDPVPVEVKNDYPISVNVDNIEPFTVIGDCPFTPMEYGVYDRAYGGVRYYYGMSFPLLMFANNTAHYTRQTVVNPYFFGDAGKSYYVHSIDVKCDLLWNGSEDIVPSLWVTYGSHTPAYDIFNVYFPFDNSVGGSGVVRCQCHQDLGIVCTGPLAVAFDDCRSEWGDKELVGSVTVRLLLAEVTWPQSQ